MKLAICGIRGIPACYGGFETFAQELATRLANRGHDVVVYGRKHVIAYKKAKYRGVRIKLLPAPAHKYFETPVHTLLSLLDILLLNPVDVVLVCNAANGPFLWLPRLRGTPVAINLDGIERKRAKWNWIGRIWYRLGEISSVIFANALVADAEVIQGYYAETYHCNSTVISYGFQASSEEIICNKLSNYGQLAILENESVFSQLGVVPGKYLLYVSRLEPENNAHIVIQAYSQLNPELRRIPLLVVGDAPYAREYIQSLKGIAGEGVIFAGYRFGEEYRALQLGAYAYIQATEVGGTHPALVEAMGFANCIIANSTPENREVLANSGLFYRKNDVGDLRLQLEIILQDYNALLKYRRLARLRAVEFFDWERITDSYEQFLSGLGSRRRTY